MIRWIRFGKIISKEGTTNIYAGQGTTLKIESRKRHIPHANRSGTWDHTTYFVLDDGKEVKELYSLKDAKEFAEKYMEGK